VPVALTQQVGDNIQDGCSHVNLDVDSRYRFEGSLGYMTAKVVLYLIILFFLFILSLFFF
jgi:hypothetical protein